MSFIENLYWRWMDGPMLTCGVCGKKHRRDSIRGMCSHAYAEYEKRNSMTGEVKRWWRSDNNA